MPYVTAREIDGLIEAHRAAPHAICAPVHAGRRGNPVLWPRHYFPALRELSGDEGARSLLNRFAGNVRMVEFDSPAVLRDCDTPDTLPTQRHEPQRPSYSNRY
jgi:molybdenum cofactor cytidylyltransferase